MKAIILCAGSGSRTGLAYPKCLFRFKDGETLLSKNINCLKKLGFKNSDIIFATGFKDELIRKETKNKFTYIKNKKYISTNMIYSLNEVIKRITVEDIYAIYADIIFEYQAFKKLINSKSDITTLIDINWLNKWKLKKNYLDDLEQLKIKGKKIIFLGKKTTNIKNIDGRFVGITKFTKKIIKNLLKQKFIEKKLDINKKIDFTNFLMSLIHRGLTVNALALKIRWFEFDTQNDFSVYMNIK